MGKITLQKSRQLKKGLMRKSQTGKMAALTAHQDPQPMLLSGLIEAGGVAQVKKLFAKNVVVRWQKVIPHT